MGLRVVPLHQAISDEFEKHGTEEDKGNLTYVLHGVARKEPYPQHIRVQLETGKALTSLDPQLDSSRRIR